MHAKQTDDKIENTKATKERFWNNGHNRWRRFSHVIKFNPKHLESLIHTRTLKLEIFFALTFSYRRIYIKFYSFRISFCLLNQMKSKIQNLIQIKYLIFALKIIFRTERVAWHICHCKNTVVLGKYWTGCVWE